MTNTYQDPAQLVCADCGDEWPASAQSFENSAVAVRDSNSNLLQEGDTAVVILKVKGSSLPLKQGTVIKNIRLISDDAEHIENLGYPTPEQPTAHIMIATDALAPTVDPDVLIETIQSATPSLVGMPDLSALMEEEAPDA